MGIIKKRDERRTKNSLGLSQKKQHNREQRRSSEEKKREGDRGKVIGHRGRLRGKKSWMYMMGVDKEIIARRWGSLNF